MYINIGVLYVFIVYAHVYLCKFMRVLNKIYVKMRSLYADVYSTHTLIQRKPYLCEKAELHFLFFSFCRKFYFFYTLGPQSSDLNYSSSSLSQ